jgi:hypothetical protein
MGFSLRKLLDESVAQVNPFDGGKTAATVRAANNRPAPAMTPAPGSIEPTVPSPMRRSVPGLQDHFTPKSARLGGFNPAPTVDPFKAPAGASQVYHDPTGNVIGWEDQTGSHLSPKGVEGQRAAAPPAPAAPTDNRGILRRMYDQINPLDSDRSFKNPTPTKEAAQESAVHQFTHSGAANATGSVINNITGLPSIIDAGRLGVAELTGNQPAIDNATTSLAKNLPRFLPIGATMAIKDGFGQDVATALTAPIAEHEAARRAEEARRMFNNNTGDPVHDSAVEAYASSIENDLLNQHMNTAGFDQNTSQGDIVKHVAGDAASTAATIAMFGSVPGLSTASLPVKAAGYGGINATSAVADTAANNPDAGAMDYLKAGGEGFVTGAGFVAAPKLIQYAHTNAPRAGTAMKGAVKDASRAMTPQYAGLTQKEIIMNPRDLDVLHNAKQSIATNFDNLPLAQNVITGLHRIKTAYGHDFIQGSRAERLQKINQFLEQNGEAIPEYQKKIMSRKAIEAKAAASGQGGFVKLPGGKDPDEFFKKAHDAWNDPHKYDSDATFKDWQAKHGASLDAWKGHAKQVSDAIDNRINEVRTEHQSILDKYADGQKPSVADVKRTQQLAQETTNLYKDKSMLENPSAKIKFEDGSEQFMAKVLGEEYGIKPPTGKVKPATVEETNLEKIAQADPKSRPMGAEQTAYENARKAGDNAGMAEAGKKLDPAMRGEYTLNPQARQIFIDAAKSGKPVTMAEAKAQAAAGDPALAGKMLPPEKRESLLEDFKAKAAAVRKELTIDDRGFIAPFEEIGKGKPKTAATKRMATESKAKTAPTEQPLSTAKTAPKPADQPVSPSSKTSNVKLNTKRLDVSKEAQARLDKQTAETVNKLSNKEVAEAAKAAGIDIKSYGVAGTKKKIAEQLNLRNRVVTIEKKIADARKAKAPDTEIAALIQESAEAGRIARSQGTDIARQLQARRIIADQLATPQQKVFRLLDEAGVNPEVYSKRFSKVNMENADEVAKAYRELVPAKAEDWLDKYRYTNMLSSPLTHIVNITSNLEGIGGIAPVQKLVEGGVDAVRSAVTGTARTRYAGESGAYLKGVKQAIPEAVETFKAVMTGKKNLETPDIENAVKNGKLAYGGAKGAADTILSIVPRFLEAADQAGMTLTKSGEMKALMKRQSKGVKVTGDIAGKAEDAALYRVFRQELGKEGQGYVLDAFDWLPSKVLEGRRAKNPVIRTISKYTLPFVTTPTNLFKQGLEYSPAGIITLAGNADKVAAVAKMTMGTATMGLAAGAFAANDAITFSEPADAKQRDAFRAEGKQPYAVKIGNKWISYSKLHPAIAFNFAAVAAVKDAVDQGNMTESEADQALRMFAGVVGFFRDQSYMKAVGDFSSNLQMKDGGDVKSAMASIGSNYANQLAPFKSLTSWIGRQIDPTQRKTDTKASAPEQVWQNMVKDIPGLNKNVPARVNPYTGDPIVNELDRHNGILPSVNAFNPMKASEDKGYGKTTGLNLEQRMIMQGLPKGEQETYRQSVLNDKGVTKTIRKEQDAIKEGADPEFKTVSANSSGGSTTVRQLSNGKYYAKVGGEFKTFDDKASAEESVNKETFRQSGKKSQVIGDNYFYKDKKGTVRVEDKFDRDYKNQDAELKLSMSNAENTDDYGKWEKAATSKLKLLTQKADRLDPEIDGAEIAMLQMQADDLVTKIQKYRGYGSSFDKPKKGGKNASSNGLDYSKTFAYGNAGTYNGNLRKLVASAKVGK